MGRGGSLISGFPVENACKSRRDTRGKKQSLKSAVDKIVLSPGLFGEFLNGV